MNSVQRYDLLTLEESAIIAKTVLSLEEDVKRMGPDVFDLTNENSLTGRHHCFNFLSNEVIGSILKPKLRKLFGGPFVVQCWANAFRKGDGIGEHAHSANGGKESGFFGSANIFLRGDPEIGTHYEGVKSVNKIGEFVIFPITTRHYVTPNPTDDIRVSMAFDFYVGSDEFMNKMVTSEPNRFVLVE
jgi:hypothetical protein